MYWHMIEKIAKPRPGERMTWMILGMESQYSPLIRWEHLYWQYDRKKSIKIGKN